METKDEKKRIELEAVKVFLKNEGIDFDQSKVTLCPPEPADVSYGGRLFQIKTAPFSLRGAFETVKKGYKDREEYEDGEVERLKFGDWETILAVHGGDFWREAIEEPCRHCVEQYKNRFGPESYAEVILIFYFPPYASLPPFNEEWFENQRKNSKALEDLKSLGFRSIYLVSSDGRNVQL